MRATGPRDVLVTSVLHTDSAPDTLDVVAVSDAGAWAVTTPLLPIAPNGCGDVTAALYLAHLPTTGSPAARARAHDLVGLRRSSRRPSPPAPARSRSSPPRTRIAVAAGAVRGAAAALSPRLGVVGPP